MISNFVELNQNKRSVDIHIVKDCKWRNLICLDTVKVECGGNLIGWNTVQVEYGGTLIGWDTVHVFRCDRTLFLALGLSYFMYIIFSGVLYPEHSQLAFGCVIIA